MKHALHTRILALLLAIAIVLSTGVLNSAGWLLASGGEDGSSAETTGETQQPSQDGAVEDPEPSSDETTGDPAPSSDETAGDPEPSSDETTGDIAEDPEPQAGVTLTVVLRAVYSDGRESHTITREELVFSDGETEKTFVAEIPAVEGCSFTTSMTRREDGRYETVLSRPDADATRTIDVNYTVAEPEQSGEGTVTLTVSVSFTDLGGVLEPSSARYTVTFGADEQTKRFTFSVPAVEGYTEIVDDEAFLGDGSGSYTATLSRPDADDTYNVEVFYRAVDSVDPEDIVDDAVPISAYVFVVDGVEVDRQWVKNGETVYAPASPEKEGCKFTGWFDAEGNAFASGEVTVTGSVTYTYTAAFTPVYYVFFLNTEGVVCATREGISGAVISADATFPVDADQAITGWYTDADLTNRVESVTLNGANVTLYPKVEKGHWITYHSDGGTYIAPVFVQPNAVTVAPAEPTREGYTFQGWYNGDTRFAFGGELDENITLTARWTGNPDTRYTIVYWIENANDTAYTFEKAVAASGTTGETVTLTDTQRNVSQLSSAYRNYFHYDHYDEDVTIKGDGSSIVNVYFARNVYSISFTISTNSGKRIQNQSGNYVDVSTAPVITIGGATYTTTYTFSAKYEEDISDKWPTASNVTTNPKTSNGTTYYLSTIYRNGSSNTSKRITLTADLLSSTANGSDTTYTFYWSSTRVTYHLHYMLQPVDGSTDHSKYIDSPELNQIVTYSTTANWNQKALTGFTAESKSQDNSMGSDGDYDVYFYYTRNQYDLTFINGDSQKTVENLYFEADISGQNYTPDKPSGVPDVYVFSGWYTTESCAAGSEFSWTGAAMPCGNLVLYAKWAAPEFAVTVYLTMDGSESRTIIIPYGSKISEEDLPTVTVPDGYTWRGWSQRMDNGDGTYTYVPFNLDTEIYSNLDLYPYYTSNQSFTITYDANGGSGAVPVDTKVYADGSWADVMTAASLAAPTDKVFLGWGTTPTGGTIYQPGDKLPVHDADITLYAIWGDKAGSALLTYDPNGGTGTATTEVYRNNQPVLLKSNTALGFTRTGYAFLGWSRTASAATAEYQPGSTIHVDGRSENVLYAIWRQMDFQVTYSYTGTVPDGVPAAPADQTRTYGDTVAVEAEPTMDGYSFSGWTTTDATVTEGSFTMPANDVAFTGSWTIRSDLSYTVQYVWGDTVLDDKTVSGRTFGTLSDEEYPIDIDGYTPISGDSRQITITTGANVIRIPYYKDVTVTADDAGKIYGEADPELTASVEGTVGNDTVAYTVTRASGEDVGDYTITAGGDAIQGNYRVTYETGTFTITKSGALTVSGASYEGVYDGNTHGTAAAPSVTEGTTIRYSTDGGTTWTDTVPTIQDVGAVSVKVLARNPNYEDATASYTLEVLPRPVTLRSESATKEYDGTPLTCEIADAGNPTDHTGFVGSDGVAAYYDFASALLPGEEVSNTFRYTLKAGTNPDNYTITMEPGVLTITDRTSPFVVTVKAASGAHKYDAQPFTVSGFESITGTGITGNPGSMTFQLNGATFSIEGFYAGRTETHVNPADPDTGYEVTVQGTPVIRDSLNNDVTDQFRVQTDSGKLTITPRAVTLTSASAAKQYDGDPLTNGTVTVSGDGFINGEGATYHVTGSQTIEGYSGNTFTYTLNGGTRAEDYTITKVEGTLTVTRRETPYAITVTANSTAEKYDGAEKTVSGFETLAFTVEGHTYTVEGLTASASGTDAGVYTSAVTGAAIVKDASGNDVTAQFAVTTVDGTLTIGKRNVTLTSASAAKQYDGDPLTNDTVTVTGDGFAQGEGAAYHVTGSQTIEGSGSNTFTYSLNAGTKAENYNITKTEGTLTVTRREIPYQITVTASSNVEKYDGTEKTVSGFETLAFTVEGHTYTVEGLTASASGTDAGVYTSAVTGVASVRDASGNDVTAQFAVTTVDGTLTIEKRNVTLTSASDTKQYDGDPLTNDTVTVTGDGFAEGEGAAWDVTGSQTIEGSGSNTFTYTLNGGTKAENYNITKVEGTLTVTRRETPYAITVVANSRTEKYDGIWKSVSGFETLEFTVEGHTYTVAGLRASADGTNAGAYTSAVTGVASVRDASGNDVTAQFAVTTVDGKLTIEKRNVTLTSASAAKQYDGDPLTNGTVTVTGDGFAEDEGATYRVTGSQTIEGSSSNTFHYILNEGTKAENYNITQVEGTLTVTRRQTPYRITVTAGSKTEKYDGTEKTVSGFETLAFIVEGHAYTVEGLTASASGTDAGAYTSAVTGVASVRDASGNDVTAQFAVTTVDGTLTIEKRNVTMTSATASKTYDGDPLTNGTVTVSGDGFINGEGATYHVTGSQTIQGSSSNAFTYTLNEGTKEANYSITKVEGTLTVHPITAPVVVTITGKTDSVVYDGTEHTVTGYDFTVSNALYTASCFRFTGTGEAHGTDAGEYAMGLAAEQFSNTSGNFTNVVFRIAGDGRLTIGKRPVTLQSESDTKEYDGTPLKREVADAVNPTQDTGFVGDDGVDTYYDFASALLPGEEVRNTFRYTLKAGTNPDNYTITMEPGVLTVTGRTSPFVVTVKAASAEHEYDAQPFTVSGFASITGTGITGDPGSMTFQLNGATFRITGLDASRTETHVNPVDPDAGYEVAVTGAAVVWDDGNNDVTNQFRVQTDSGKLTITPRDVTLTSASAAKQYDKTPLTNHQVTVTSGSFANGDGAAYDVTGSQTRIGSSENEFTYTLTGSATAQDYRIQCVNGTLTVTPPGDYEIVEKSHEAPEEVYKLGDEIPFTITVENIFDAEATVKLTEQEGVDFLDAEGNRIGRYYPETTLAAGETLTVHAVYTVQEKDLLEGAFANSVAVEIKATVDENTYEGEDDDEDIVSDLEDPKPELTVEKTVTSTPEDPTLGYRAGEDITYEIVVENTGNLTISNIVVSDRISVAEEPVDLALEGFDGTLAPGESVTFPFTHTVVEQDLGKTIGNQATATGANPTEEEDYDGEVIPTPEAGDEAEEVKTEPIRHGLTITKEITNPKEVYRLRTPIQYSIVVTNTGNVTERNVTVEDVLINAAHAGTRFRFTDLAGGTLADNKVVFASLAPGESLVICCEYKIGSGDLSNVIGNKATVTSGDVDTITSNTVEAQVEREYVLRILYVDEEWNAVATSYWAKLREGERYSVTSPEVEGYTPNRKVVRSGDDGMPAEDVWEYVIYTKDPVEEPTEPLPTDPTDPTPTEPAPEPTYELTPVTEEEPPAEPAEEEHACCILHFLLMVLSMILLAFYTNDRKKLQKRVFELKRALKNGGAAAVASHNPKT